MKENDVRKLIPPTCLNAFKGDISFVEDAFDLDKEFEENIESMQMYLDSQFISKTIDGYDSTILADLDIPPELEEGLDTGPIFLGRYGIGEILSPPDELLNKCIHDIEFIAETMNAINGSKELRHKLAKAMSDHYRSFNMNPTYFVDTGLRIRSLAYPSKAFYEGKKISSIIPKEFIVSYLIGGFDIDIPEEEPLGLRVEFSEFKHYDIELNQYTWHYLGNEELNQIKKDIRDHLVPPRDTAFVATFPIIAKQIKEIFSIASLI